ncbi:hypothetical protein GGI42DRAFT_80095 [Trichoderma sp. SZMC 28013]
MGCAAVVVYAYLPTGAIAMHQKQATRVSSRACEQTGSPSQEPNVDRSRLAAALPIASEPAACRLHPGLSISPGSVDHLPLFSSSPCWRGSKPSAGVHHSVRVFVPLPPLCPSVCLSSSSSLLLLAWNPLAHALSILLGCQPYRWILVAQSGPPPVLRRSLGSAPLHQRKFRRLASEHGERERGDRNPWGRLDMYE